MKVNFDEIGDESSSDRERERVDQKLERISTGAIESRLEEISQGKRDDSFTSASGVLLAEWGRRAPEAALEWVWDHFKDSHYWDWSWREIGPEWAWADPEGFLQYYRERSRKYQAVAPADAEKSETPLILGDSVHSYQEWLAG